MTEPTDLTRHEFPNAWRLRAADFDTDLSFSACCAFLGDVSSGSTDDEARRVNFVDDQMFRAWQGSRTVRRAIASAHALRERDAAYAASKRERTLDPSVPPRPGSPDPHGAFSEDGRRGLGRRLADWGRALVASEPEGPEPPQRFIPIGEMSSQQLLEVRLQARANERRPDTQPSFGTTPNPESQPWPEPDPSNGWRPSVFGAPSGASFPWPDR